MEQQDELWDYYSGLPNPLWYEKQNKLHNDEDNIGVIINKEDKE